MDDNITVKDNAIPTNDQDACFICGATNVTLRRASEDDEGLRCPTCWHKFHDWLERVLDAERRMRNLEFSRGA